MRINKRRHQLLATQDFSFFTSAPAEQVWATLTSPTLTPAFFYGLLAGSTDPVVYLTWHVQVRRTGCIVRLEVDESELTGGMTDEDKIWLTLTASLQDRLVESA